jgi:phospholipid/cholesterol/gamma-HCH transport system permease protein
MHKPLTIKLQDTKLSLNFLGELTLYNLSQFQKQIEVISLKDIKFIEINLENVTYIDTAVALFFDKLKSDCTSQNIEVSINSLNENINSNLELVKSQREKSDEIKKPKKEKVIYCIGKRFYEQYIGFLSFMEFFGKLLATKIHYLKSLKNIKFKEIAYEINETSIKALGIIALTSFLIGLVVAYQSAYQLKIYGANIFIVDMLGLSILRELAPLITAIVVAGRSGSAFTAQIGAMKITQELDAMRTMGFDPYVYLVFPRIIALMLMMPILIFVADIMGMLGGMIVSNIDLGITPELFLDRFSEVISLKHFVVGVIKGPFFAFLIASIGIYRGLMVQNDTQSIGFNTTKSVVESIFAVIVCDAVFSIAFTNLGI